VSSPALQQLADDLWVASRPLPIWTGDIGARMTVARLDGGGLLLHSPVAIDPATKEALDAIGRVRWVVGPSRVHHLFLGDCVRAWPSAELYGAPGLAEKRKDLSFRGVVDDALDPPWGGVLRHHLFAGAPLLDEVVFLHRPSRTLVLTDLAFNVQPGERNRARLFHWLVGAVGRFGPHRLIRLAIRDRAAARTSLAHILAWDFDRVVVSHGEVLERGGHAAVEAAFAFLGR
jgi:Domain of unknown function (DUF4336)